MSSIFQKVYVYTAALIAVSRSAPHLCSVQGLWVSVYACSAALIAVSRSHPCSLQGLWVSVYASSAALIAVSMSSAAEGVSVCLQCCPHRSVQVCPQ